MGENLAVVLMKFDSDEIQEYEEIMYALIGMGSYLYASKKLDSDMKYRPTPLVKPSIR